ncbi:MAG: hypothetical protein V4501_01370 [Pseudomonadota bacterium]
MARSYTAVNIDDEVLENIAYLDDEGNDVFYLLQASLLGRFFSNENEVLKIVNLRRTEAEKLLGDKLEDYIKLIQIETGLLATISELDPERLKITNIRYKVNNKDLVQQARSECQDSLRAVAINLSELAKKLLKSPSTAVAKDVKLLANTANSILNFYTNAEDPRNIKELIENTQLVHKKMGTYWRPLKSALTALVGVALILVGVLSLAPSFGASVALIAVGSSLCAASGLALFKPFMSQKAKSANELSKDVSEMLTKAKKLLSYNTKKEHVLEQKQQDRSQRL